MRLPVCEHPAVTFGSSAHGSLLHAKFQFCGQIESMHNLNFAHGIECLSEGECDDKEKEISR